MKHYNNKYNNNNKMKHKNNKQNKMKHKNNKMKHNKLMEVIKKVNYKINL